MRELVLVLPENSGPAPGPGEAGLVAARFAPVELLRGGWRGWLARSLGLPALAACDTASVVALSLAEPGRSAADPSSSAGKACSAWIATPLQLAAGMQTVHVPADGVLVLEPGEAAAWAADFAGTFGADGLELRPAGSSALLLLGLDAQGARTVEPAALVGRSLESGLPGGTGAARVRALMAEIEMWLHDHPLNAARQARGRAPVASFWLWGGGGPVPPALPEPQGPSSWDLLRADDPWVAAVARLAGVAIGEAPRALCAADFRPGDPAGAARVGLVVSLGGIGEGGGAAASGLAEAIDRCYVRPAIEALRAGQLAELVLAAGDRATRLSAADRFRFWRPERDWRRALAA